MIEQLQQQGESLPSPEEQEQIKLTICHFFEERLTELESGANAGSSDYVQQFYELCTGSDIPWTRQKEFVPSIPELPMPFRIRFDRHSGYQPELKRMSISIEPLLRAHTAAELQEAILTVLEVVYHETEHIFFPVELEKYEGAARGMTTEEGITYLCQNTEINAYARQFAFRYSREYPNEPFTLDNMQRLAERLLPQDTNANNYFVAFANPTVQEKYKHVANLATAHASIVAETKSHFEKLQHAT